MQKRFSEDKKLEWKSLIEQQRQSGLSIRKWCLQKSLIPNTFHYWKNRLFPKEIQSSSFVELKVKQVDEISLQTRGIHIRLGSDCDPLLRREFLALFARVTC